MPLLNDRMYDGSRHFSMLPQTVLWDQVRNHITSLPGATVTSFVCDGITEAWIDFTFQGHSFSINDQLGDYWFFVQDPECPDPVLQEVVAHFERLLRASKS